MFSQVVERPKDLRDVLGKWKLYPSGLGGMGDPKGPSFEWWSGNAVGLAKGKFESVLKNSMRAYGFLDDDWKFSDKTANRRMRKRRRTLSEVVA